MIPSGRGVPPKAEMRHKLRRPLRGEENTISRLSGVHAGDPEIERLSKVSRFAAPPVAGTTKSSLSPLPVSRTKATVEPSGEKVGNLSEAKSGGDVSGRVVESESENNATRLPSEKAKTFPSGDQFRHSPLPLGYVYNLCSEPPKADIT